LGKSLLAVRLSMLMCRMAATVLPARSDGRRISSDRGKIMADPVRDHGAVM
jgi:hypothetical protein